MKKPDFSAFTQRLKSLFRFGSKKGEDSTSDFEDRYYDETDPETEAEDVLDAEAYEDYEEDPTDAPPPMQMEVPKPETPPSLPIDESSAPKKFGPEIIPGSTSPKELKLGALKNAGQTFRDKFKSQIGSKSSGLKLKLKSYLSKEKSSAFTKSLQDLWRKYGGEHILSKPLASEMRPLIHQTFLWLVIASTAFWGAKFLAKALTPNEQIQKPALATLSSPDRVDIDAIARNDVFGAKGDVRDQTLTPKKPINDNVICRTANQKSSLQLELLNTVVLKDSVKSIASVQSRGSKDFLNVREGDKVQNLAEVGKIDRLRLIIKNLSTGECEFIETKDGAEPTRGSSPIKVVSPSKGRDIINKQQDTGIRNEGNRFNIKKSLRDEMLTNNMSEILTQARAVQMKRPDGTLAFKMTEIVPGSIYAKLNIQDGDVITGINGKSFNNLNEVMTLFSQIREIDNFQISMEREGTEQTLEYNFE